MKRTIEERRSTTTQYMILMDEKKINPSNFKDVEIGKQFRMESGIVYEVFKIQKNEFLDIEFLFLTINYELI